MSRNPPRQYQQPLGPNMVRELQALRMERDTWERKARQAMSQADEKMAEARRVHEDAVVYVGEKDARMQLMREFFSSRAPALFAEWQGMAPLAKANTTRG